MNPTVRQIKYVTALHFAVDLAAMNSQTREKKVARPRQVAMYLSRKLTTRSYPQIGRAFDRDHTTILHGVRQTMRRIAKYPKYAAYIEQVEQGVLVFKRQADAANAVASFARALTLDFSGDAQ